MTKDIIHFSHANGFPAPSYGVIFDALSEHYQVGYIDRLGHNENFPVTDNWPYLVDELITYIESHYLQPIIAVGHSLGGLLSYMAVLSRPDLFKCFIMLDAPLLSGIDALAIKWSKRLGMIDKLTPAGRTRGRKESWPDQEAAEHYFAQKSLLKNADSRCLRDYVRYGTEPSADGIRLRFEVETEMKIYRTLPHTMYRNKQAPTTPGGLIYGQSSNVIRGYQVANMRKSGIYTRKVQGGHLFPLEYPEFTASQIIDVTQKVLEWK